MVFFQPSGDHGESPLAERQFRLEGLGDLQYIRIVGFDCIVHYGPADFSGLAGFSLCLIREGERKSAVCVVHRTDGFIRP